MRYNWKRLFEDIYDNMDSEDIAVPDTVVQSTEEDTPQSITPDKYEFCVAMCFNKKDAENIAHTNLEIEKIKRIIEYALDVSPFFVNHSIVFTIANKPKPGQKDVFKVYLIDNTNDTNNFIFGFNKSGNNPIQFFDAITYITNVLKNSIDNFLAYMYLIDNKSDDYIKSLEICLQQYLNYNTLDSLIINLRDSEKTIGRYSMFVEKAYAITSGLNPYKHIVKRFPQTEKARQKKILKDTERELIRNFAKYNNDVTQVISPNNKIIKKMCDTEIDTSLIDSCFYISRCKITEVDPTFLQPFAKHSQCGYYIISKCLKQIKTIKPANILLKQYDNRNRIACIIHLCPVLLLEDEPPYDLIFVMETVIGSTSYEFWKSKLIKMFNLSEEEYAVIEKSLKER